MDAKVLWLVRHGETVRSRDHLLAGWADIPLTPRGEEEALALAPFLTGHHFDTVTSSDLQRAVTTARLAWGEVRTDARLREVSFGDLEGHPWETLPEEHRQGLYRFSGFAFPGGERDDELEARVHAFLEELPPGRHLVFSHGGIVRLLAREVGVDAFPPTGSVTVIDWTAKRLLLRHPPEPAPRPVEGPESSVESHRVTSEG
ncbi:MAG: histidine phosphatase family protein [Thermoanaerobaculaceae bacterium]|nr:histidine phosphatase family protein [Thermoanaerobaculaceae bacterium]